MAYANNSGFSLKQMYSPLSVLTYSEGFIVFKAHMLHKKSAI